MNSFRFSVSVFALTALLSLVHIAHAATADGVRMVGEVTLLIGEVTLVSHDGVARSVERGSAIREGDRIETGAGGHVHLRFVDGGRLSVRPSSRLQIEDYRHAGEQQTLTTIKFRLDEGLVRSITGSWGEAERERFRLNTPLAAIGVKGTDFVVRSDANNTLATVYTGAIVLTPMSSACQASVGPCQNGFEKMLSEDMKGQMLSLSRQQASPQLVAAIDLLAQRSRAAPTEAAAKVEPAFKPETARADVAIDKDKVVVSDARAVGVVVGQATSAAQTAQNAPVVVPTPTPTPAPTPAPAPTPSPVPVVPVDPVIPTPAPVLPPVATQLSWARLLSAADGDTLSVTFAQAIKDGRQSVTGNGAFTLYRDGAATALLASADTSANFRLVGGTASLVWDDRGSPVVDPVRVDNGTLSVDFSRATYSTQVNVSSARLGADNVASNGVITPTGMMQSVGGNSGSMGALSLDGKEAGYFFVKTVAAGNLNGITLWGR